MISINRILVGTNQKKGIPLNDTFLIKQLEISIQQQIPTWNQPWIIPI